MEVVPEEIIQRNLRRHKLKRILPVEHVNQRWFRELESAFSTSTQALCHDLFSPNGRSTAFVFVDRGQVDAFADMEGKFGIIALNFGSIYWLTDFVSAMLSHPKLFTQIGEVKAEELLLESYPLSDQGIIVEVPYQGTKFPRIIPRDTNRARFALLVTHLTLDFMFLHEVSHVIAGHPKFAQQEMSARPRFRARSSPAVAYTNFELTLRHGMEIDADCQAGAIQIINLLQRQMFVADSEELPESLQERLFALAVALVLYFLIISPESYSQGWPRRTTHPHPYLRLSIVEDIIRRHCLDHSAEAEQIWSEAYLDAAVELTEAWGWLEIGKLQLFEYFQDEDLITSAVEYLQMAQSLVASRIQKYDLRALD